MPKGASITTCIPREESPEDGLVFVKTYKIDFSAGPGCINYEEDTESEGKSYRLSWLQKHRLRADKLKVFHVSGDSMEPVLFDGDSITVNTADTEILNGRVYAFTYAGEFRVKRLRKLMNGSISVLSDNPSWDTEIIPTAETVNIHIVGRVVDRSGSGGL